MFDKLISGEEKQSPIDALLKMLELEEIDNRTFLEMPHIKVLVKNYRLYLRVKNPEMQSVEIDFKTFDLYKKLRVSYKGMSWEKIVEGIKEMKPQLMQINAEEVQK